MVPCVTCIRIIVQIPAPTEAVKHGGTHLDLSAGEMEGHKHTDRLPDLTGQTAYPVDEFQIQKDSAFKI